MKTLSIAILLSLITSYLPAKADIVKCQIIGAKASSVYEPFIGGTVTVDLENGNSTFFNTVAGQPIEFSPITDEKVSSFQTSRSACFYGTETVWRTDGSLRSKQFNFNSCVHRDPGGPHPIGYVRSDIFFDIVINTGKYRELLLTPTGTPPSAFVDFKDCRIVPR